jgi:hypothetical protein
VDHVNIRAKDGRLVDVAILIEVLFHPAQEILRDVILLGRTRRQTPKRSVHLRFNPYVNSLKKVVCSQRLQTQMSVQTKRLGLLYCTVANARSQCGRGGL